MPCRYVFYNVVDINGPEWSDRRAYPDIFDVTIADVAVLTNLGIRRQSQFTDDMLRVPGWEGYAGFHEDLLCTRTYPFHILSLFSPSLTRFDKTTPRHHRNLVY